MSGGCALFHNRLLGQDQLSLPEPVRSLHVSVIRLLKFFLPGFTHGRLACGSSGLQCVELEDIVVGGSAEVEGLSGHPVVTGAAEAQGSFKVQQLPHEVEVGGNVGFLHLHDVVGVVHGQVELLHQVSHGDGDRAADAGQAVHQHTAALVTSFI